MANNTIGKLPVDCRARRCAAGGMHLVLASRRRGVGSAGGDRTNLTGEAGFRVVICSSLAAE